MVLTESFDKIFRQFYEDFDYKKMSKRRFSTLLYNIGVLGYEWIDGKDISEDYVETVNILISMKKTEYCPLEDYCYHFFYDLLIFS